MTKRTFFLLAILGFCAMWQKADATIILGKPQFRGPSISSVGSTEEFYCKLDNIPTNETILYKVFRGDLNKALWEYSSNSKQAAKFIFIVSPAYDGRYICKASVQNNTEIIPTFSEWKHLQVLVPVKGAQIISSRSLEDLWEGDSLILRCNISEGTFVSYDWFLNDKPLHNDSSTNQLTIPSLSSQDSGKYVCFAKNYLNETHDYTDKSEGRDVHVKEYLSKPKISVEVSKNAEGNFNAYVKCQVTKGSLPINFTLFRNNQDVDEVSRENLTASFVVPIVLDQDMGTVYCQAYNGKRPVHSRHLNILEYPSKPEISFEVAKNAERKLSAYVNCQVTKGSPPLKFTFFRNNHNVFVVISEQQFASFVVPIELDQDMGTVYCQAQNGERPVQSRQLNLTVESVGGTPTMNLKTAIGQDFEVLGVWLRCHVHRGTFPQYYWFFNDRRLENDGEFYRTYHQDNSGLTVRLHPRSASAGTYHCEAFNSFDNTTRVSSPNTLISHEALNKIPTGVAVIVFTCFSLLICAVFACCIYGVVLRKRKSRIYMFRLKDFTDRHSIVDDDDYDDYDDDGVGDDKTERIEDTDKGIYEEIVPSDDLDTESYIEDMAVVHASMMEDHDESEEEEETDLQ